nr:MAG TPA: hypothetical protein [Caudoviricetes sp.]
MFYSCRNIIKTFLYFLHYTRYTIRIILAFWLF